MQQLGQIVEVPVSCIEFTDDLNIRGVQENSKQLAGIVHSMKQGGFNYETPVVLRYKRDAAGNPITGKYLGVDGRQRTAAAGLAGLENVAAVIKDMSDEEARAFQLMANRDRVPQKKSQELAHIKLFLVNHPLMTQEDIGVIFRMEQSAVSALLGLERLTPEAMAKLDAGKITVTAATALARIPEDHQNDYLADAENKPSNEFIVLAAKEARRIRQEAMGITAKDEKIPTVRKKTELVEEWHKIQYSLNQSDAGSDEFAELTAKLQLIEWVLRVDAATIEAEKAERAARKKSKSLEELEEQKAKQEAKMAELDEQIREAHKKSTAVGGGKLAESIA